MDNPIPQSGHLLDLIVIVGYFIAMAMIGIYFTRRNRSTESYFLGNRSIPGWAIGLSMMGTLISSITFLALPAGAYALDWRMILPNLTLPLISIIAVIYFIPFFRNRVKTSAFEYLEQRFGPTARLYGAFSFVVLQILRMGMVLFLVSMPISLMLHVDMVTVILVCGVVTIVYSVGGGLAAVIWTDVIQAIVLLAGGFCCFVFIIHGLPGGLPQVFEVGSQYDKFDLGDMRFDFGSRTMITMLCTGAFGWIAQYTSDQNVIQRYLAAPSLREARKATNLCAVFCMIAWIFFFFLGTCLFVYFKVFPNPVVDSMSADQVLPYFIIAKLPPGLTGIIIAGVLAAAMSTLSSGLNSVSTVLVVDVFKRHLTPGLEDRAYLLIARVIGGVVGLLMIVFAVVFLRNEHESVMDLNLIIPALFGGALTGIYMLGFFVPRVDNRSMLIGLSVAIVFNVFLMLNSKGWLPASLRLHVHDYWVSILVNAVFAVVALLFSFILPRNRPQTPASLAQDARVKEVVS